MRVPFASVVLGFLMAPFAWSQQANVNLDWNPQKNTENLVPFSAPLNSPDVRDDRTVTFRLLAPKATDVTLNGSWDNGTDLKMTKDEAGVWSATIGPLAPQLWGYWFVVDGVKALDPNNGETQRDGSRYDNLLMISGPESEW